MLRSHHILGDETGVARPPVYLTGFRPRRRPKSGWATGLLTLLIMLVGVLALAAATG